MKKAIYLLAILFIASSCINLKSPYPDVSYYRLNAEPYAVKQIDTIEATIQMRNLTINDEFNTDHIIASKLPSKEVQVYYYHRWISKFDDLISGYVLSRINSYGIFKGGFVPSNSINVPNYILEGRILHVQANNNDKKNEPDANWVELTINMSFYKRSETEAGLSLLFNKNYTQRINRQNSLVETIPQSMSKAIAFISDMVLVDMHSSIKNDINKIK